MLVQKVVLLHQSWLTFVLWLIMFYHGAASLRNIMMLVM